jgi:hypothetical protein
MRVIYNKRRDIINILPTLDEQHVDHQQFITFIKSEEFLQLIEKTINTQNRLSDAELKFMCKNKLNSDYFDLAFCSDETYLQVILPLFSILKTIIKNEKAFAKQPKITSEEVVLIGSKIWEAENKKLIKTKIFTDFEETVEHNFSLKRFNFNHGKSQLNKLANNPPQSKENIFSYNQPKSILTEFMYNSLIINSFEYEVSFSLYLTESLTYHIVGDIKIFTINSSDSKSKYSVDKIIIKDLNKNNIVNYIENLISDFNLNTDSTSLKQVLAKNGAYLPNVTYLD